MQHEMNASDWIWMTPLTFSWIVLIALALYVVGVPNSGDELGAASAGDAGRGSCATR